MFNIHIADQTHGGAMKCKEGGFKIRENVKPERTKTRDAEPHTRWCVLLFLILQPENKSKDCLTLARVHHQVRRSILPDQV